MKLILGKMKEAEAKAEKSLKTGAFDDVRQLGKLEERLRNLEDLVETSRKAEFEAIKHEVDILNKEVLAPSWFYDLSVGFDPSLMTFNRNIYDRLCDSIFLQTPVFGPNSFMLVCPNPEDRSMELNSNYIEVEIRPKSYQNAPRFTPFLMRSLKVLLSAMDGVSLSIVEESSLWAKVQAGKAQVAEDGMSVTVKLKKPAVSGLCNVSARLFETNIGGSPLLFENQPGSRDLVLNVTAGASDLTLGVFDQDLDGSYYGTSLARNHLQQLGYTKLLTNPSLPASPALSVACRISDEERLQGVNGNLKTTELVQRGDQSTLPLPAEEISTLPILESMNSILDPAKKSSVSVEEAQASLSDSESLLDRTRQEQSANMLDRSVSFAPRTAMVSVLATPQVLPGESRFITVEGVTKQDGLACGPVKRLHPALALVPAPAQATSVWDTSDVVEDWDEEEDNGDAKQETRLFDETYDSLNESKAPTPEKDFGSPDPVWNLPTSDNISILPASFQKDQTNRAVNLNCSVWNFDEETPRDLRLNLVQAGLEENAVYTAPQIGGLVRMRTTRQGSITEDCLAAPHSVAYSPHWHIFLVSEPDFNRIGLYNAETFEFIDWLRLPTRYRSHEVTAPSYLKTLNNGCLAIVTREVLMIFAADLSHLKVTFRGSFRGLAESREGDIFTIADTPSGPIIKKIACKGKNSDFYSLQDGGHIRLEVVREFKHWERQARPSFLLWWDQTLVITDPGLHKIYQINLLNVKEQKVGGYYGCGSGQISQPSGMMVDDLGNFLVCDRANSRLTVFDRNLKHVKEISLPAGLHTPISLLRWNNYVLVVSQGNYAASGGAVAWKWSRQQP